MIIVITLLALISVIALILAIVAMTKKPKGGCPPSNCMANLPNFYGQNLINSTNPMSSLKVLMVDQDGNIGTEQPTKRTSVVLPVYGNIAGAGNIALLIDQNNVIGTHT